MIKLSLLIPTVPVRLRSGLSPLVENLMKQIGKQDEVEVIALLDNKKSSVGRKRNQLLSMAQGEYIAFIDDDDRVSKNYLAKILKAIKRDPHVDLVVFDIIYTTCSKDPRRGFYGIACKQSEFFRTHYYSPPCHIHVWRRELVKDVEFPETNYAEDRAWVAKVLPLVKTEAKINDFIYFYDWNPNTTQTGLNRF